MPRENARDYYFSLNYIFRNLFYINILTKFAGCAILWARYEKRDDFIWKRPYTAWCSTTRSCVRSTASPIAQVYGLELTSELTSTNGWKCRWHRGFRAFWSTKNWHFDWQNQSNEQMRSPICRTPLSNPAKIAQKHKKTSHFWLV